MTKEGNKRYTTEVHVDQLQMLERSQDAGSSMAPQSNAGMSANSPQEAQLQQTAPYQMHRRLMMTYPFDTIFN